MATVSDPDPVRRRRARVAGAARLGTRVGLGLFGLALILVVVGYASTYTPVLVTVITACLVVGSVVLAPALIAGMAARAAEREDRSRGL
jgi:hypothetical protein